MWIHVPRDDFAGTPALFRHQATATLDPTDRSMGRVSALKSPSSLAWGPLPIACKPRWRRQSFHSKLSKTAHRHAFWIACKVIEFESVRIVPTPMEPDKKSNRKILPNIRFRNALLKFFSLKIRSVFLTAVLIAPQRNEIDLGSVENAGQARCTAYRIFHEKGGKDEP